jgi:hypothetical protein
MFYKKAGGYFNKLSDYEFLIKACYVGLLGILFGNICGNVRLTDVPVMTLFEANCEFNITYIYFKTLNIVQYPCKLYSVWWSVLSTA